MSELKLMPQPEEVGEFPKDDEKAVTIAVDVGNNEKKKKKKKKKKTLVCNSCGLKTKNVEIFKFHSEQHDLAPILQLPATPGHVQPEVEHRSQQLLPYQSRQRGTGPRQKNGRSSRRRKSRSRRPRSSGSRGRSASRFRNQDGHQPGKPRVNKESLVLF